MKTMLLFLLISNLSNPNDQRLFESGLAFQANQNYEQALREFNVLVEQYPSSPYADNALLEIGTYYFKNGDIEKTMDALNRIITSYPKTDSCDNAQLLIGVIQMNQGKLDEAYDTFFHLKGAYPESDVLDKTYYYLAEISVRKAQFERALYFLSNIYTRFSESPEFEDALYKAAYCFYRIGKSNEALTMMAAANEIDGDSPKAKSVELSRNLLRFAFKRQYRHAKRYFEVEGASIMEAGKDNVLYVSSSKDPFIQIISPGQNKRRNTPSEVRALFYSEPQGFKFSTGGQIFGDERQAPFQLIVDGAPVREITSFFLDGSGRIWAYDKDTNLVYLFSRDKKLIRKLVMGKIDFIKIRRDGLIFVVGDSRDLLEVRDQDGNVIKRFNQYKNIIDVGFDSLDNVFLLTDKGRHLVVLTYDFQTFQSVELQQLTANTSRYNHLAVDSGGNIFLSLSREGRIVKVY